ncbi:unnamed protein product [Orchesella dallaii]|uniref:C2H2-type domain-containing protein n=1 Tax=Orchesella dallaii TaxID=48710 RepID=A0ABP1RV73_9HEXA
MGKDLDTSCIVCGFPATSSFDEDTSIGKHDKDNDENGSRTDSNTNNNADGTPSSSSILLPFEGDSAIQKELQSFFILKTILKLPNDALCNYVSKDAGKPNSQPWAHLCVPCGHLVTQFYETLKQFKKFERKLGRIEAELQSRKDKRTIDSIVEEIPTETEESHEGSCQELVDNYDNDSYQMCLDIVKSELECELENLGDDDEVESRIELENFLELNEENDQYSEGNLNDELPSFSAPLFLISDSFFEETNSETPTTSNHNPEFIEATIQLPSRPRGPRRKGDTTVYAECSAPKKRKLTPKPTKVLLNMKPKPKSYQCPKCPYRVGGHTSYKKHLKTCHGRDSFATPCSDCGVYFYKLSSHQEYCTSASTIQRNVAHEKQRIIKGKRRCVQNSHPKYLSFLRRNGNNILWIFKCRLCPFETLHLERIETHVQIHEEGSGAIACGKCGWFLLPQWMEAHSNVNHPPPPEPRPSTMDIAVEKKIPTIYKCIQCPYQSKVKGGFENHIKLHEEGTATVVCEVCGICVRQNWLESHSVNSKIHRRCLRDSFSKRKVLKENLSIRQLS